MTARRRQDPRGALSRFAARPRSRWSRVGTAIVGAALVAAIAERRGPWVGALALLVYGTLLLGRAFDHRRLQAIARRHRALDGVLVVPLALLALAYFTSLAVWVCLLAGIAEWVVLTALRRRKERRPPQRRTSCQT